MPIGDNYEYEHEFKTMTDVTSYPIYKKYNIYDAQNTHTSLP